MYFLFKKDKLFNESIKLRPVEEFININLYRPLAFLFLLILLKLNKNIKPETIVIFHTILIILSAVFIFFNNPLFNIIAFFLINLKIILDNLDGQYSRIKKLESELGRYLDTLMDFLGNFILFLIIGIKYNYIFFSIFCFFLFTFILSYDFNLEYLYRYFKNEQFRPNIKDNPSFLVNFLKKLYNILLEYQDNFIRSLENKMFNLVFYLVSLRKNKKNFNDIEIIKEKMKEIFWSKFYLHITANMGLSTQLFILSLLILFNMEFYFFYFVIFQFLLLILLLIIRIFIIIFYIYKLLLKD